MEPRHRGGGVRRHARTRGRRQGPPVDARNSEPVLPGREPAGQRQLRRGRVRRRRRRSAGRRRRRRRDRTGDRRPEDDGPRRRRGRPHPGRRRDESLADPRAQLVEPRRRRRPAAADGRPGLYGRDLMPAPTVAVVGMSALRRDVTRLTADVRTSATKTGGAVRMGRASLRYAGWVEFGGHRKAPHPSTRQFEPRGRYLFPAALTLATAVANRYDQAVTQALNSFQWTNETTDAAGVHD